MKEIEKISKKALEIKSEISKALIGEDELVDNFIIALFSGGHVLLEGVPGTAKTLIAKLFSAVFSIDYKRVQFTPDLMPSDLIGISVFNKQKNKFEFIQGPLFTNLVLADEINRSPAKTQAALFEVMEEKQITYDGKTYKMNEPYFVVATQNPIEYEGTYRLPEAQIDRFMMKLKTDYLNPEEEIEILEKYNYSFQEDVVKEIKKILKPADIIKANSVVKSVHSEREILKYIIDLVDATRNNPSLLLGASPRAALSLLICSKSAAVLDGRDFIIAEDIRKVIKPVLNHRLILTPEKEVEGITTDDIIDSILSRVEVPR